MSRSARVARSRGPIDGVRAARAIGYVVRRARACATMRRPERIATRVVAVRARLLSTNVTLTLWLRIVTTREPCATVRPRRLERQLTRTRPLRVIAPLTRSRRPLITAVIFVFAAGRARGWSRRRGGGGGAAFLTSSGGDVTLWVLPAASMTTRLKVCGPSATRARVDVQRAAGLLRAGLREREVAGDCVVDASVWPVSLRTSCCWMPLASLAVNVTGTTPETTPPPHARPADAAQRRRDALRQRHARRVQIRLGRMNRARRRCTRGSGRRCGT